VESPLTRPRFASVDLFPQAGRGKLRRWQNTCDSPCPLGRVIAILQLNRHTHGRPQASERAVGERDVTAVGAGDVAGDRKTQTGPAFILIARDVAGTA
jgi:hypothetical protein